MEGLSAQYEVFCKNQGKQYDSCTRQLCGTFETGIPFTYPNIITGNEGRSEDAVVPPRSSIWENINGTPKPLFSAP
jgi:hypothetical protein